MAPPRRRSHAATPFGETITVNAVKTELYRRQEDRRALALAGGRHRKRINAAERRLWRGDGFVIKPFAVYAAGGDVTRTARNGVCSDGHGLG